MDTFQFFSWKALPSGTGLILVTLFQNIRSIQNKIDETQIILTDEEIDIVCLCETWLTPISQEYCNIEGYALASSFTRSKNAHGGVAIYVRKKLETRRINKLEKLSQEFHCEIAACEIEEMNVIVICVYRSPSNSNVISFMNTLHEMLRLLIGYQKYFFIYGDFNFDILNEKSNQQKDFVNLIESFGLKLVVQLPTRTTRSTQSCLDNCITNFNESLEVNLCKSSLSDHDGIKTKLFLQPKLTFTKTEIVTFRPTSTTKIQDCVAQLNKIKWNEELSHLDVVTMFITFQTTFLNVLNTNIPEKTKTRHITNKNKEWYTNELKEIREKLLCLIEISKSSSSDFSVEIRETRNFYKLKITEAKRKYFEQKIKSSYNKPKEMWKTINSLKTRKSEVNTPIVSNNFNNYFTEVANILTKKLQTSNMDPAKIISNLNRSHNTIFLTL